MAGPLGSGLLTDWTFENAAPDGRGISHVGDPGPGGPFGAARDGDRHTTSTTVEFEGLARFSVESESRRVIATWLDDALGETGLSHLLLDQVAPKILAQLGHLVLHASAVEIGGKLALFLGDSGAGKSTLAASFHASGFPMPGDDAIVVSRAAGSFLGEALYRSLRMHPDTARAVLGSGVATEPMAEYSPKRKVSLPATPAIAPLPIGALFFLNCPQSKQPPQATRRGAGPTCIGLLEQSFSLDPDDTAAAQRRFADASALANAVPAFDLSYPDGLDLLGEVRQVVIDIMTSTRG